MTEILNRPEPKLVKLMLRQMKDFVAPRLEVAFTCFELRVLVRATYRAEIFILYNALDNRIALMSMVAKGYIKSGRRLHNR
ncbi:MAG: hypothetical protein QM523_00565 [Candidatus Pacebacteria bacterium]|nr:hypothetical protein [Candidatus Paceibacterota bacterium]